MDLELFPVENSLVRVTRPRCCIASQRRFVSRLFGPLPRPVSVAMTCLHQKLVMKPLPSKIVSILNHGSIVPKLRDENSTACAAQGFSL